MKFLFTVLMTVILMFSIIGCDEEKVTGDSEDMVQIEVHLLSGLADNIVYIVFNDKTFFNANLTGIVPLAGPAARFTTYLPRGSNTCEVVWKKDILHEDSADFILEMSEEYFMRISVENDSTMVLEVQDNPFSYL